MRPPIGSSLPRWQRSHPAGPRHSRTPASGDQVPGLTTRESEIVGYLVAGGTYAEIARALVLSEKTVSVHVSNMLRKTGTASRVELTQLANRLRART